jgi:hypothetical protein
MTFQEKLLTVAALAALIAAVVVMRPPGAPFSARRSKPRLTSSVGMCLAVIAAALLAVGVVSHTLARHVFQIAPIIPAIVLSARRSPLAVAAAVPLFAFWLLVMGAIWLFLLGVARIFTGTFSPAEIALTLVVGAASLAGVVVSYGQGTSTGIAARLCTVGVFALLQCAAMWLSVQPFAALLW